MTSPGNVGGVVPRDLLEAFRSGRRFLLSSHAHPDGDAIGSEVALARLLRASGKATTIWNADPAPEFCRGILADEPIHVGRTPPAGFPDEFDWAVPLECPRLDRTELEDFLGLLPTLNVDHHLGNQLYGRANWVDTEAPAVAEMVLRLARQLGFAIDPTTATALYLGLSTDTGSFRFANTTSRAFEAAAELVRYGARPEQVAGWVYESQSPGALRLLAEMLDTLELHSDGRVASARLELSMFERAGARSTDAEGLIAHPRSIRGVEAVALFRERPEGDVKVSLRSRGQVDVGAVASRRDGGGHHNAAGCFLEGAEAERALLAELAAAVEEAAADRPNGSGNEAAS